MNAAAGSRLLNAGAIGSSIGASICCVGPLALAVLGLGGGALLSSLEPYRPYFLAATGLFLGGAFYLTYDRESPPACESDSNCSSSTTRTRQKMLLWIVFVVAVLAAAFPYLSGALF